MFHVSGMCNHGKGHSHNILDQLYGLLAHAIQFVDNMADIYTIRDLIQNFLNRPGIKKWFGPDVDIQVIVLESVRNWQGWLDSLKLKWTGGMRDDATGLHCWLFMFRKDLPNGVNVETVGWPPAPHPLDVVVVVKRWVTDPAPSQDPVLVLPHGRLSQLPGPVPVSLRPPKAPKYPLQWLGLAQELIRIYPADESMRRAAKYLLDLSSGTRGQGALPALPWHSAAQGDPELVAMAQAMFTPIALQQLWPAARLTVRVQR